MRRRTSALLSIAGAGLASFAGLDVADRRRIADDPVAPLLFEHPEGEEREVVARDGTRLHAELFGPADAPPVVLIHGWTCALRFWRRQIRSLMPDHRVVAYDLRGHGASGTPDGGDWSLDAFGDDLECVLEQCTDGRPALVAGHSLGAMTVVAWAGRHPDEVRTRALAVALCNTGLGDLVSESLVIRGPHGFARVEQAVGGFLLGVAAPLPPRPDPVTHRAVRYIALSAQASPAEVRFCEELVLDTQPRVRAALGRELSHLDLRQMAERVAVPTLVVAGGEDRLTPPVHARSLAQSLPDCTRLLELEGAGHMCPVERADDVTGALRELEARALAGAVVTAGRPKRKRRPAAQA
jgi:pimeloyl-ACP methyl ester carboxylesterase